MAYYQVIERLDEINCRMYFFDSGEKAKKKLEELKESTNECLLFESSKEAFQEWHHIEPEFLGCYGEL